MFLNGTFAVWWEAQHHYLKRGNERCLSHFFLLHILKDIQVLLLYGLITLRLKFYISLSDTET